MQTKLKKLGFYNASIDGDYGDTTVAAVKAFQKKYNLTADGVAGSETLKKLDSAYKNADSNTSTDDDSLRKGATGTAVKTLQTNLKKLGFYGVCRRFVRRDDRKRRQGIPEKIRSDGGRRGGQRDAQED